MSNWFTSYSATTTGQALADIIDDPEWFAAFRTLSEQGKPAVQAVAADVAPIIENLATKKERDAASQFVGWYVGQVMRDAGYNVVQERGRVSNAPYKTGAVWQLQSVEPRFTHEAPAVTSHGRLSLHIALEADQGVAEWELTTSETSQVTGRPRRVHRIMSLKKPLAAAVSEVLAYARRYGYRMIWIHDPANLYPKAEWPTT